MNMDLPFSEANALQSPPGYLTQRVQRRRLVEKDGDGSIGRSAWKRVALQHRLGVIVRTASEMDSRRGRGTRGAKALGQGAWPYTILPPNIVKITAALLSSSAGIVSTSRSIKVRSARLPALIEPISAD